MYYGGIEDKIISCIKRAVDAVLADLNVNPPSTKQLKIELEIPKEKLHGDLSSNIAMRISRLSGKSPMEFANILKGAIESHLSSSGLKYAVDRIETRPPGFINFFLSKKYLTGVLLDIKRMKAKFGSSGFGRGVRLQVEFVSANPTGPLTIAHGRQAAFGDSLANVLQFLGYRVTREYYLNDEGTQMDILGNSIRIRYMELFESGEVFPVDGYKGAYITDIAKALKKKLGRALTKEKRIDRFREFGMKYILKTIRADLSNFGVKFNVWYSQKALTKSGKVDKALAFLRSRGHIYENEGAVWFKSSAFGDDKDRVVIKSDGSKTYLAPDIAYHMEKYRSGFRRIIDIWGPDHHGYVPRIKAAVKALGFGEDSLSVIIVQLATLYKNGQVLSMSTRAGEFITLREVMDEVGKDVARFCFIMRRASSHLDFDLDVVKKESMENPVYYIQYAHARIWSIIKRARQAHLGAKFDSDLLKEEEEFELLRMLRQFPFIVGLSGRALEPYVILQYLQDVAAIFHSFYTKHRVIGDDPLLAKARLVLVDCTRIVLANGLRLLGVSLPKSM